MLASPSARALDRSGSVGPVLVIDDHPLNCTLLERLLELDGYETIAAGSIGQAEAVLEGLAPALIVLDLRLPDGDGSTLARRLKANPRTSGCPIVACSAGTESEDRRRALGAGCDAYVGKPIDISSFARLVADLTGPRGWDGQPPARASRTSRRIPLSHRSGAAPLSAR